MEEGIKRFCIQLKGGINDADSALIELKTLWEKMKMLVTSNFSFSHNIF